MSRIYRAKPELAHGDRQSSRQLQMRFDAAVRSGAIPRQESQGLQRDLRQLIHLERQYSRAGFNSWERRALRERSRTLSINLATAERSNGLRGGRDGHGDDRRGDRGDKD